MTCYTLPNCCDPIWLSMSYADSCMVLFCLSYVCWNLLWGHRCLQVPLSQSPLSILLQITHWATLTLPNGLLHETILDRTVRNCSEKGRHFQNILGRWLDEPSVYHHVLLADNRVESEAISGAHWEIKLIPKPVWRRLKTSFPLHFHFFALLSGFKPSSCNITDATAASLTSGGATIVVFIQTVPSNAGHHTQTTPGAADGWCVCIYIYIYTHTLYTHFTS